jgi:hypothetical protein
MRIRKNHSVLLMILFSSFVLMACSVPALISDLFMDDPDIDYEAIEIMPGPDPNMAGVWQDKGFDDIFIINWNGEAYVVDSVYWKQEVYPIIDQLWAGDMLTFMYFDSYLEEMVTVQTISVSADKLLISRIAEEEKVLELVRLK